MVIIKKILSVILNRAGELNPVLVSALILAVFIYSGLIPLKTRDNFYSLISPDKIIRIEGVISSNPVKTSRFNQSYRFLARINSCQSRDEIKSNSKGYVQLYIPSKIVEALYPGKIYTSSNSGQNYLIENGSCFLATVKVQKDFNDKYIFLVNEINVSGWYGNFFTGAMRKFRAVCRLQFKRLMYSWKDAGGFLLALLSGSREYSDPEVSNAFRDSGLSHILALSGMHLSLFGGIAFLFGRKIINRNIGMFIQLSAILFFVWFAGFSPSLFRAFLSSLILFFSYMIRINPPGGITILSFTFLIHICASPYDVWESSFMLSYSALAGIILFSHFIKTKLPALIPYKLRSDLATSISAQASTAGICLKLFGKVMPVGIIASLIVSPLVVLFIYLGLVSIVICLLLPFLSQQISVIMNGIYNLIKLLVCFFCRFS